MRWLIAQRWEQLLFAHWPAEPDALRRLLPRGVEPDVHDGAAWLSIVAFLMVGTRPPAMGCWRGLGAIPELNVRTYVRVANIPGVWFVSLDTSSPLFIAIGRALYGLRYRLARMTALADGDVIHYLSAAAGAAWAAAYAPSGPPGRARAGSLEHFLVERYRLFSVRHGRLITARVAHEPWALQPADAEIAVNRMAPAGLAFRGAPLFHFSRSVSALIAAPVLVRHAPVTATTAAESLRSPSHAAPRDCVTEGTAG
jgi:uncharacterized protein YqjF (DUF2071 family)